MESVVQKLAQRLPFYAGLGLVTASTLMLQGGDATLPAKELALLKDTLERELGRSA